MTDWFVHDPALGRVGPLSTDALRERYRQRRVQRDTLVWHAELPEWQPLDRVSDAVGIDDVVPDASLPPPLPAPGAALPRALPPGTAGLTGLRHAPPPRRMSGCAIAAIVLAVVALPLLGILAAIALPAYQDYVERSRDAQGRLDDRPIDADPLADTGAPARDLVEVAVIALPKRQTQCPDTFEFERALVHPSRLQGSREDGSANVALLQDANGRCGYGVVYRGVGGEAEGKAACHDVILASDPPTVTCRN